MASSIDAWIATLIENCLSTRWRASQVEDDGSNLRFFNNPQHFVVVNSWAAGDNAPTLNVTDFHTQIDAILGKESIETYRQECPKRPFNKDTVRGNYLKLLDFEVVFEYSMSQPKLHLYVTHFKVASDKGRFRGPPQGKGIKRSPSLFKLTRTLFGEIKSRTKRQNALVDTSRFHGPPQTQPNEVTHTHDTQELLASQVQPTSHTPRPSTVSKNPENGSGSSDKLLGLLEPNPKKTDNGSVPNRAHSDEPQAADSKAEDRNVEKADQSRSTLACQSIAAGAGSAAPQSNTNEKERPNPQPSKPGDNQKRSGELNENVKATKTARPAFSGSPEKKSPDKTTGTGRSPDFQESQNTGPWHDMAKIHKRDVTIPENQAALLQQHTRLWVPPAAGESMPQGHVPPALLSQWNDIAYKRSRFSKADELKATVSQSIEPVDSHEPSPDTSSSASESESEAESEGRYSWDNSPERDVRPRQQLPADSSPVERHSLKVTVAQANNGSQGDLQPTPENHEEKDASQDKQSVQDLGQTNGVNTGTEAQMVDIEDAAQGHHPDSDEESEDSMMDTSVPCPLAAPGSQQPYFLSQSEAEITSSGQSLPGHHPEQIQVEETPAGHFNRHQPAIANQNKSDSVASPENITTPQAKSSSQSRILDTYPGNQTSIKNTQESPNPSQENEFHEVDIMGTPFSNGSWQSQNDATFPRPTMDVPNSTSQSDESSKPFSSHNEILSSNPSGENAGNALDIPISAQGPSIEPPAKSPLKRFASELDAEERSPAKRSRVTQQTRVMKELTPGVIFRRQSYIGGSSNHVEAQRIYEKFRSDYPPYEGDFLHFAELCFKLRAFRAKGHLKRSFLWDDFVIQHLKEYQQHVEETQSQDGKSQEYEDYFASNFSRPSFKKRSLTTDGIEIAASQHMPAGQTGAASPAARPQMGTSFTGSLADKFSNLQAHSFGPATQDLQSDTDDERMSAAMSSPTPHERARWYTPVEGLSDHEDREDIQASNPKAAEREHDTERGVAGNAEGAGHPEVAGQVESNGHAEPPQDVEMAEVVEVAAGVKDVKDAQEVEAVERAEVEIIEETKTTGGPETNGEGQRPKDVEMVEAADVAEEAQDAEHAETTGVVEVHRDTEGSQAIDVSQNAKGDESTQDVEEAEDIEDTRVSQNSQKHTDGAENAEVSEVAEIEEANVVPETQEFEVADESSHEYIMDETHETASIELGDSGPATTARASEAHEEHEPHEIPAFDAEVEAELEAEPEGDHEAKPGNETAAKSINESWFRSLRHIYQRPPAPAWFDDYNTPFKKWARADQNVFKERQRRGGARIPVDEKGVIQRFEY